MLRREGGEEFLLGGGDEPVEVFQAAPAGGAGVMTLRRRSAGSGARRMHPASDSWRTAGWAWAPGVGGMRKTKGGNTMRTPVSRRAVLTVGMASTLVGFTEGPAAASRGPATPSASTDGDLQRQVDAILATGVAGVGAEVMSPYGRRRAFAGTPRDGRFRIGSLTKTFTAVVPLQLPDLTVDTVVRHWLPEVTRDITVRDLLRHTSRLLDPGIPALTSAAGYRAERLRSYAPEELAGAA